MDNNIFLSTFVFFLCCRCSIKDSNADLTIGNWNSKTGPLMVMVKNGCISLNTYSKISKFFFRNIKLMQKFIIIYFLIIVQTALIVGQFWTIEKITPKSAIVFLAVLWLQGMIVRPCLVPWIRTDLKEVVLVLFGIMEIHPLLTAKAYIGMELKESFLGGQHAVFGMEIVAKKTMVSYMYHSLLEWIWIKDSYLSQWLPQGERGPP